MLKHPILQGFNLLIKANCEVRVQLKELAGKIIQLNLPLVELNFIIDNTGLLILEDYPSDCQIELNLNNIIAYQLVAPNELIKQLKISGDSDLAFKFLIQLADIKPEAVIYLSSNPLLSLIGFNLNELFKEIFKYLNSVKLSLDYSLAQYMQYEKEYVVDHYQLEKFYNQVDSLVLDYERLQLRFKKLL